MDPDGEEYYHRGKAATVGSAGPLDAKATKLNTPALRVQCPRMTKRALGHLDEAISDLTDAIQQAPENIEFFLNRSTCFLDVDDRELRGGMTEAWR